jgi:hypothetical protein
MVSGTFHTQLLLEKARLAAFFLSMLPCSVRLRTGRTPTGGVSCLRHWRTDNEKTHTHPMNNTNMRYSTLALALIVGLSNNIILFNEEILITVSFLGFLVAFAHLGQQTIAEAFDTRKALIQQELQAFFTSKEMLLQEVAQQAVTQLAFTQCVQAFESLAHTEMLALQTHRESALQNTLYTQVQKKLKNMTYLEKDFQEATQHASLQAYKPAVFNTTQLAQKTAAPASLRKATNMFKEGH